MRQLPELLSPVDEREAKSPYKGPLLSANEQRDPKVREHSSAEERCGPHVAICPVMLWSSNNESSISR